MSDIPNRTGVCLVRAEDQRGRTLITIRLIPDITHEAVERVIPAADIDTAVEVVRAFLTGFANANTSGPY